MGTRVCAKRGKSNKDVCFLCGSAGSFGNGYGTIEVEGREYRTLFCANCGLGKTDPFLDEKRLKELYSSTYREAKGTRFPVLLERIIRKVRVQRCVRVERFAGKGRVLDIGCGRADFLTLMAERGWDAYGIELDERIKLRGETEKGVHLRYGTLEDVRFENGFFGAVTFWHVFEHLRQPEWVVRECGRILEPGGLLMIAVPNMRSMQARLSGKKWFHLDPPYHLFHYTLDNLKELLKKNGFRVDKVRHFSFEYNPYGFLQSIYNLFGFRNNLFYDFLRSRHSGGVGTYLSLAAMFAMLPVLVPLSLVLSLIEAAFGYGGTIEVYAKKTG